VLQKRIGAIDESAVAARIRWASLFAHAFSGNYGGLMNRGGPPVATSPVQNRTNRSTKKATDNSATFGRLASDLPAATFITLAHRIPMLFTAPFNNGARIDPEMFRMVFEKSDAVGESANAIGDGWSALMSLMQKMSRDHQDAFAAVVEALNDSNPTAALRQLHRQGQVSADLLTELGAAIGEVGSRTAVKSLRPAHRRVVANAKRLSKPAAKPKAASKSRSLSSSRSKPLKAR
jgi:hypothetical protein